MATGCRGFEKGPTMHRATPSLPSHDPGVLEEIPQLRREREREGEREGGREGGMQNEWRRGEERERGRDAE